MGLTVHNLRKNRYNVQVLHNRVYDRTGQNSVLVPTGGSTVVIIYNKQRSRIVGVGYARCKPNENYSRKLGVQYALENLPEDFKMSLFTKCNE